MNTIIITNEHLKSQPSSASTFIAWTSEFILTRKCEERAFNHESMLSAGYIGVPCQFQLYRTISFHQQAKGHQMADFTGNTPVKGVHIQEPWFHNTGHKTAAQSFVEAYAANIEVEEYKTVPLTKWYSPNAIFHAQNNVTHHGGDAIGEWMRGPVFGGFEQCKHTWNSYYEILPTDGDSIVIWRATRHVWIKGNKGEKPDVDVPMLWICTIGKADSEDGYNGLQYKEIHLSWDTAKVAQLMRERGSVAYQGVS